MISANFDGQTGAAFEGRRALLAAPVPAAAPAAALVAVTISYPVERNVVNGRIPAC
jgi:hypothetical protein